MTDKNETGKTLRQFQFPDSFTPDICLIESSFTAKEQAEIYDDFVKMDTSMNLAQRFKSSGFTGAWKTRCPVGRSLVFKGIRALHTCEFQSETELVTNEHGSQKEIYTIQLL